MECAPSFDWPYVHGKCLCIYLYTCHPNLVPMCNFFCLLLLLCRPSFFLDDKISRVGVHETGSLTRSYNGAERHLDSIYFAKFEGAMLPLYYGILASEERFRLCRTLCCERFIKTHGTRGTVLDGGKILIIIVYVGGEVGHLSYSSQPWAVVG